MWKTSHLDTVHHPSFTHKQHSILEMGPISIFKWRCVTMCLLFCHIYIHEQQLLDNCYMSPPEDENITHFWSSVCFMWRIRIHEMQINNLKHCMPSLSNTVILTYLILSVYFLHRIKQPCVRAWLNHKIITCFLHSSAGG
jgi:hypothetical protein